MNSKIILEIDYREKAIIKHLEENKPCINYVIKNLDIGDFIFKELDTQNVLFIIERKTILDLASSITDGRFREQKARLLESVNETDKIIYILEGNKNQKKYGNMSKAIIDGSIVNLVFKHKYKVLKTCNDDDTYEHLLILYKKLNINDFDKIEKCTFKPLKKKESINKNIIIHMLSVIPGISYNIAQKISENYKTLPELINAYNKLDNLKDKEALLSIIQLTDKRKLGMALSKKVYHTLFKQDCLLD